MSYSPPIFASERLIVNVQSGLATELNTMSSLTASAAWPAANLGIYVPLYIQAPFLAQQIFWQNGSTVTGSTSMEVAVYNEAGTVKLITSGVVTQAGVSVPQAVTITGGLYLPRGRYWIGMVLGNNTSHIEKVSFAAAVTLHSKMVGCGEQALGGTALPASITFATAANGYLPVMGLSSSSLVL